MRKFLPLSLLLVLCLALAGCASNQTFPDASDNNYQRDPLSVATATPDPGPAYTYDLPEDYDPASEEDNAGTDLAGVYTDEYGRQPYAGATPIPLDPVDLPTPTPRPSLAFNYTPVTVNGLTFEAPVGWQIETPSADTFIMSDPVTYDNYNASMTVRFETVPSNYTLNDVKTKVNDMLKEIGQYNYTQWSSTSLAERTLLKKDGYYANYRGVYYDGTIVRGRVMVALLDNNQIITLHMTCPGWFNESYMNVVAHFRDTVKRN